MAARSVTSWEAQDELSEIKKISRAPVTDEAIRKRANKLDPTTGTGTSASNPGPMSLGIVTSPQVPKTTEVVNTVPATAPSVTIAMSQNYIHQLPQGVYQFQVQSAQIDLEPTVSR